MRDLALVLGQRCKYCDIVPISSGFSSTLPLSFSPAPFSSLMSRRLPSLLWLGNACDRKERNLEMEFQQLKRG